MSVEKLKLYIYQHKPKEIIIDTLECKEWDEVVIVAYSLGGLNLTVEELAENMYNIFPNKKILLMPKEAEISLYGVRESKEDEDAS